jgi:formiminotetrahydrofolate cyclodeaminase
MLVDKTVKNFIDELASDSPAPGGGSISALSGACGAALLSMFAGLTIGKEKYRENEQEMVQGRDEAHRTTGKLLTALDKDTDAFNQLMEAFRLPKETDGLKDKRKAAIKEAVEKTIEVPLQVAKDCVDLLEKISILISKGNTNAVSDAGVGALMLESGLKGAVYNVKINLLSLKDEIRRKEIQETVNDLLKKGNKYSEKIAEYVEEQIN